MWLFLINLDGASWLNTILFCVLKPVYGLLAIQLTQLDHNDPSKPSHRLTNGPEPTKTIESDGSNIKKPS